MKKTISIMLIIILILSMLMVFNNSHAVNINQAYLYSIGQYTDLLKYNNINIITTYVVYQNNGIEYPAYCLQKDLLGVGEQGPYTVNVNQLLSDVMIWRAVINGYPYKSYEQLGCANKQEAYFATKQAIYCIIYNRTGSEYSAIGEAGQRTLNAMMQILNAARASTENKINSNLTLEESEGWILDNIDNKYISKIFTVKANATLEEYEITIDGQLPEGSKIVDLENKEKNKFNKDENFKIIMPITNISESRKFYSKCKSKCFNKTGFIW